jgi:hypothetical protein
MRRVRCTRQVVFLGVAIVATAVAGCVDVGQNGAGETIYTSSRWFGGAMIALGLVAAAVGIRMFRNDQRAIRWLGGMIVLFGVLFAGAVGPSPYFDELRVAPDHYYLNVGFWFARNEHYVDYKEIEHVDLTSEVHYSGRSRSVSYYMLVFHQDRQRQKVPIGDLMKAALDEILSHFQRLKIPVHDLRKD